MIFCRPIAITVIVDLDRMKRNFSRRVKLRRFHDLISSYTAQTRSHVARLFKCGRWLTCRVSGLFDLFGSRPVRII